MAASLVRLLAVAAALAVVPAAADGRLALRGVSQAVTPTDTSEAVPPHAKKLGINAVGEKPSKDFPGLSTDDATSDDVSGRTLHTKGVQDSTGSSREEDSTVSFSEDVGSDSEEDSTGSVSEDVGSDSEETSSDAEFERLVDDRILWRNEGIPIPDASVFPQPSFGVLHGHGVQDSTDSPTEDVGSDSEMTSWNSEFERLVDGRTLWRNEGIPIPDASFFPPPSVGVLHGHGVQDSTGSSTEGVFSGVPRRGWSRSRAP